MVSQHLTKRVAIKIRSDKQPRKKHTEKQESNKENVS